MTKFTQTYTDAQLEQLLSRVLRIGVFLSAITVSFGGVLYLLRYGMAPLNYHIFQSKPDIPTQAGATDVALLRQCSLIQLGLLILLMTPILRVAFSAYAFAKQRDRIYLLITLTVLAILLFSLFKNTPDEIRQS
jgi:uncharacterized membrane protein